MRPSTSFTGTPSASNVRHAPPVGVAERRAQQIGHPDHVARVGGGLSEGLAEHLARVRGDAAVGRWLVGQGGGCGQARRLQRHTAGAERRRGHAVAAAQDAQQEVLRTQPGGAQRVRLLAGQLHRGAGLGGHAQLRCGGRAGRGLGRGGELAVAAVRGLAGDAEGAGDRAVRRAAVQRLPRLDAFEGVQLAAQRGQVVERDLGVRSVDGVLEELGDAFGKVYRALQPRSMVTGTPEKAAPPGPARKAMTFATSSGSIRRFTACGARMTSSRTASSLIPCAFA